MNPITRLRHGLFLTNKHLTPSEASLEIITSPVPILFIKMFIQADNYFDILIHRKLIIVWSTQQTEKWDDTRHRQSRSKPDSFLPQPLCTEAAPSSLVTGLASWGGLQSGSDGLSLTSGGGRLLCRLSASHPASKLSH